MVRMCTQILFNNITSLILFIFILWFFFKNHKVINNQIVKIVFSSRLNTFTWFLLNMNINRQLKMSLNLYKQILYITMSSNKVLKKQHFVKHNLNYLLQNFKNLTFKGNRSLKVQKKTKPYFLIFKPIKSIKLKNGLTKFFLRKSKFFTKTKYSWIRQECKNIVHLVLLFNIIVVFYSYSIYMKWSIKTNLTYTILSIYTIFYIQSLTTLKVSFINILKIFNYTWKPITYFKNKLKLNSEK